MKVLIVEDNRLNMKLVSDLLKSSGHEVLEAVEAESGIAVANQELPDLILMDIQLPGMNGLDVARLLKNDKRTQHIKIIALTAFAMEGDKEKALEAGCDGYVTKPIRYKEFLEAVESCLKE